MSRPQYANHPAARRRSAPLPAVLLLIAGLAAAEPPPAVLDSQSIVRGLGGGGLSTRGLQVAAKPSPAGETSGAPHKIDLDIRFANDSDQITSGAQTQLAQLGRALSSPELAHYRFLIAGHTSATGSRQHNQHLSELRARAVRSYLLQRFNIAPGRIDATGYGSSRPLPGFAPEALQQRRVEVSALPETS
jgi:outer membrane protein OmpA-like peptidoglycan-associated protein